MVLRVASLQSQSKKVKVPNSTWGGQHIGLEIANDHTTLDFDCAHGNINQPFETDSAGAFDLAGTYVKESPGPARQDAGEEHHQARYSGRIEGKVMTLTIKLIDRGEIIGRFTLKRGALPQVAKCG